MAEGWVVVMEGWGSAAVEVVAVGSAAAAMAAAG